MIEPYSEFKANVERVCSECDQMVTVLAVPICNVCKCIIPFKVAVSAIINSKCPLNKW